jgi:hypothetical protein
MDLLAANPLARAFYDEVYAGPQALPNLARYTFLDAAARRFYSDWGQVADITVAILRTRPTTSDARPRPSSLWQDLHTRGTQRSGGTGPGARHLHQSRCAAGHPGQPLAARAVLATGPDRDH